MTEEANVKGDKFEHEFTSSGEAYITLEQARVVAILYARDNSTSYGDAYSELNLVWEVISQEDGEDYYDIKLSFRPEGRFRGEPGAEQYIIDKLGRIVHRQMLDAPSGLDSLGTTSSPAISKPKSLWQRILGWIAIFLVRSQVEDNSHRRQPTASTTEQTSSAPRTSRNQPSSESTPPRLGPIKANSRVQRWQVEMGNGAPWEYVAHGYNPDRYIWRGLLDTFPLVYWVHLRNSGGRGIVVGRGQAKEYAGITMSWARKELLPRIPDI